jgi:hypothetical protein
MLKCSISVCVILFAIAAIPAAQPPAKGIRFRVKLDPKQVGAKPESGRVLVGIAKGKQGPDFTNYRPPVLPILGTDAEPFAADTVVTLDNDSMTFPSVKLNDLPPGDYTVQAVFATSRDINLPDAPGNRYCDPVRVRLDPRAGSQIDLTLNKSFTEATPKETATVKFHQIHSKLLSDFHGRPMLYRVGVVLPSNFAKEPNRKYGLIVDIGGFGTRYSAAAGLAPDPRFVQIVPDGAGPFGADQGSHPVHREYLPLYWTTRGTLHHWWQHGRMGFAGSSDLLSGLLQRMLVAMPGLRDIRALRTDRHLLRDECILEPVLLRAPEYANDRRGHDFDSAARVPARTGTRAKRTMGVKRPRLGELECGVWPER